MTDVLGWRKLFGVVTPSTNTVVQPEYDGMRPSGVTNHIARMHIPDDPIGGDADFDLLIERIDRALEEAVDRVVTCRPDHIILGISAESIWGGGLEAARAIETRIAARSDGCASTQAAMALPAALDAYGAGRNIAILTPYQPVAERHLQTFAAEIGRDLVRTRHLACTSPTDIARTRPETLRRALRALDGPDVDAIIQFGANLPMGRIAAEAENWLEKPVIAVNVATYWHALRTNGIGDRVDGWGRLLSAH